jgi:hypothetical protein
MGMDGSGEVYDDQDDLCYTLSFEKGNKYEYTRGRERHVYRIAKSGRGKAGSSR